MNGCADSLLIRSARLDAKADKRERAIKHAI